MLIVSAEEGFFFLNEAPYQSLVQHKTYYSVKKM